MLTTTLDGLWALQVLSGHEVLAPELGLRPYLPSAESRHDALSHPVSAELNAAGLIAADGSVDDVVLEWLSVLSRREVGLSIRVQTPNADEPEMILVARRGQWWVALGRHGPMITMTGVGIAATEDASCSLITSLIEQTCGRLRPASFRPVTLDIGQLLTGVHDSESLRNLLIRQGLDAEQIRTLALATDPRMSAQACFAALQTAISGGPAGSLPAPASFSIIDTTEGRVVSEQVQKDGKLWLIVGPGSQTSIASAAQAMLRSLSAGQAWHQTRKAFR